MGCAASVAIAVCLLVAGALPAAEADLDAARSALEATHAEQLAELAAWCDEKGLATVVYKKAEVDVTKIVTTINEKTSFKAKSPDAAKT